MARPKCTMGDKELPEKMTVITTVAFPGCEHLDTRVVVTWDDASGRWQNQPSQNNGYSYAIVMRPASPGQQLDEFDFEYDISCKQNVLTLGGSCNGDVVTLGGADALPKECCNGGVGWEILAGSGGIADPIPVKFTPPCSMAKPKDCCVRAGDGSSGNGSGGTGGPRKGGASVGGAPRSLPGGLGGRLLPGAPDGGPFGGGKNKCCPTHGGGGG